jgi:hypothetical protein
VVFTLIDNASDAIKKQAIYCLKEIVIKEPLLVLNSYEGPVNFNEIINTLKDGDPDIVIEGIEFWT